MTEIRGNIMKENPAETEWNDISYEAPSRDVPPSAPEKPNPVQVTEIKPAKRLHRGRKRVQDVLGGDYLSINY